MDIRIKTWKCPNCGKLVSETDYGYPSYGSICHVCRGYEEEENNDEFEEQENNDEFEEQE